MKHPLRTALRALSAGLHAVAYQPQKIPGQRLRDVMMNRLNQLETRVFRDDICAVGPAIPAPLGCQPAGPCVPAVPATNHAAPLLRLELYVTTDDLARLHAAQRPMLELLVSTFLKAQGLESPNVHPAAYTPQPPPAASQP